MKRMQRRRNDGTNERAADSRIMKKTLNDKYRFYEAGGEAGGEARVGARDGARKANSDGVDTVERWFPYRKTFLY